MKKFVTLTLLIALCLSLCACNRSEQSTKGDADCYINGTEIFFVEESAKDAWREPLAKLLANVLIPYGEHGEIMGYKAAVDSNAPAILYPYACGLLDITRDGVPELLVYPLGYSGSSGGTTYYVYDIFSGERIGSIGGGINESWCEYYDLNSGSYGLVGQYWLKMGWEERNRHIVTITFDKTDGKCSTVPYLHTSHTIAAEQQDVVDEDPNDPYYSATWVETYPETEYFIGTQAVTLDEYYDEYDLFVRTRVRIPETEMITIRWGDIEAEEDDYATHGRKMAEALLATDQKFIKVKK